MCIKEMTYITDGKRHLICLPYSIPNLHIMAQQLNIKRCWFHKDHYDIPKRRISEIEAKCTKITTRELLKIINS
jgi:hypothetical protein